GVRLPAPGRWKQLEDLIGELHSITLDRTKPLWRFTVVEGLENGQVALYSKVHHAAVDGGAGMVITKALYDLTPIPREVEPPEPYREERKPSLPERAILGMNDMAMNLVRQQIKFVEALPKVAGQIADLAAPALKGDMALPQVIAPKTPFNGTIGAARSYVARSVSLEEAKAIGKATGTKINDVVMAICSGCLRAYLDEKHILPDAPLTAFVPISLREMGNTDLNNQVFGMNCSLATNYGDPVKRLKKIHGDSRSSKMMAGGVKDMAPQDYTVLGAPMLLPGLMQLYGRTRLADVLPNPVNVTISNTAGPPVPLYCAGAKVTALYPVSIPVHGVGVNFTVQSYLGKLDFGVTGDAASVPDMERMGDLLVASFEELREAVLGPRAAPADEPVAEAPAPEAKTAPPAAKPAPKKRAPPARAKAAAAGAAASVAASEAKAPAKTTAKTAGKTVAKTAAKAPAKRSAAKPKAAAKPAAKAAAAPRRRAAAKPKAAEKPAEN
ncbi:MAG: wax ester/triacylglycerol synthase family O-acyltransferase, partial [Pseudomonadota bacterium]